MTGVQTCALPILGVGLGLAVCRGMIAAHAGTITAANRPDGGAILTVRLPFGGAPPLVEAEPSDPSMAGGAS